MAPTQLASWRDGEAKQAIEAFVARVTAPGSPDFVTPRARIAVFDNDGTLWTEKPMPIELGFILERLASVAAEEESLRDRQPWKAACTKDFAWLGEVVTKHYRGDDSDVKVLMGGMLKSFEGMSVDAYAATATAYLDSAQHPTLERRLRECSYQPMVELLRYLEAHGFTNYIASGGDRDFMRVVTDEIYGIPAERVVGSSTALSYLEDGDCGSIAYLASRTCSTTVRPSRCGSGVASGGGRSSPSATRTVTSRCCSSPAAPGAPALRLLLLHDDEAREFDYVAGAEKSLQMAAPEAGPWSA